MGEIITKLLNMKNTRKLLVILSLLATQFVTVPVGATDPDNPRGCACLNAPIKNTKHCNHHFSSGSVSFYYTCDAPKEGETKDCYGVTNTCNPD
jgi:hypothetical protein